MLSWFGQCRGDAEAIPEPEADSEAEADARFVSDGDGIILDDDAIILVSPGQKNFENRSPRQYRGRQEHQRAGTGNSQTAKDLVSGKFSLNNIISSPLYLIVFTWNINILFNRSYF